MGLATSRRSVPAVSKLPQRPSVRNQRNIRVECTHGGTYTIGMNDTPTQTDYDRVEQAIRYIEDNFRDQPALDEIAASVHLSKHHFQRLFKRWAGISPTQFLQFLTLEYAKQQLAASRSVFDTALDAGLSSSGRLHDLFVNFEAMTPGEYKRAGSGLTVRYGFHPTPLGEVLLAATERGVCGLHFVADGREDALALLRADWGLATLVEDCEATAPVVEQIFGRTHTQTPLTLLVKGTNFQINVWRALLRVPSGALVTYGDVAEGIGRPTAVRATASAIARNPIGYIIPCHRVINKVGSTHNYRWGSARKKALLGWEAAAA